MYDSFKMAEMREANNQRNPELIRLLKSIAKSESGTNYSNPNTCKWTGEETKFLLKILTEYDYLSQIKSDNEEIYEKISSIMSSNGYKKSNVDIKSYWIELKDNFFPCKSEEFIYKCSNDSDLLGSETDMVIIKGEKLDNDMLESQEKMHNFYDDLEQKTCRSARKNNWTYKETECVVEVLEKYGMPNRSNFRKICFIIVDHLKENGFLRSEEQAQIKMKQLRGLYNQVTRKSLKEEDFPFFSRIKEVMQMNVSSNKLSDNEDTCGFNAVEELSKSAEFDDIANNDTHEDDNITRKARQIWTNKEVQVLLRFIEDNNIVSGKQLRKVSNEAVDYLAGCGYVRSPTQILIRWKNTKAMYWATFRKKLLHPERECSFFYQLHNMLNPEDKSYETRILDVEEDDDLVAGADTARITEIINFHFNKTTLHQPNKLKEDNSTSFQNSSNSGDNFINLQNSITNNTISNTEILSEPSNADSIEAIPSSPKRSRTEPTQTSFSSRNCSSCNILDSVDHYCISLAHSIKRLDPRKQAKLKIEIQQLMYKAEFDSNF